MSNFDFSDGLQKIHTEAGGILMIVAVGADEMAGLVLASMRGDAEATTIARLVLQCVARVEGAPRNKPVLCTSCPRRLRGRPFTAVIGIPDNDAATRGLGFGICERCSADKASLPTKIADALHGIWPESRIITTHKAAGRA